VAPSVEMLWVVSCRQATSVSVLTAQVFGFQQEQAVRFLWLLRSEGMRKEINQLHGTGLLESRTIPQQCVTARFLRGVNEICTPLGFYAA
jgi:hypothetical protein